MYYLICYFLGIYSTIAVYAFLPRTSNRFGIMLGLHLIFTVPASYFLGKDIVATWGVEGFLYVLLFTIILATISVLLSGAIVRQIK